MAYKYLLLVFLIIGALFTTSCAANQDERKLVRKFMHIEKLRSHREHKSPVPSKGEEPVSRNKQPVTPKQPQEPKVPVQGGKPSKGVPKLSPNHRHSMRSDKFPKGSPQLVHKSPAAEKPLKSTKHPRKHSAASPRRSQNHSRHSERKDGTRNGNRTPVSKSPPAAKKTPVPPHKPPSA